MNILKTSGWEDYELLDSGEGKRLERFGKYVLIRPDPQCIWLPKLEKTDWFAADAEFKGDTGDKRGRWVKRNLEMPDKWVMEYNGLQFYAKLSPFKHTGVFPEQCLQWEFIRQQIANGEWQMEKRQPNILNLFGYTGVASLVAAQAGAKVTHVDASYPTIGWARENQVLSGLQDKPIRWIEDDAIKFVSREIKRGVQYDGIIMDPPVYGHGSHGEVWDFNASFPKLLHLCKQVLTDKPLFIIINAYAVSASALMLQNVLEDVIGDLGGEIEVGELCLEEKENNRLLSTGIFARWKR